MKDKRHSQSFAVKFLFALTMLPLSSPSLLAKEGMKPASTDQLAIWNAGDDASATNAALRQWDASDVLLIGEVHGTTQVPRFVGRLIAQAAEKHPVVVALERTDAETNALNAFLSSSGSAADKQALAGSKGWSSGMPDGRSSVAMLDLLDQVRKLRQAGKPVTVLLTEKVPADLSVLQGPGAAQRYAEKSIADTIRQSMPNAGSGTHVIALMGSYHLRIPKDGPYGASVASQLSDLSPTVVFVDGLGSAWTCIDEKCAAHPVSPGSQLGLAGSDSDRKTIGNVTVVSLRFPALTSSPPASGGG